MHPGRSGKWRARGNRKELEGGNRKEDMDRNQAARKQLLSVVRRRILTRSEDVDAAPLFDQHWPHPNWKYIKMKTIPKIWVKILLTQMVTRRDRVQDHHSRWQDQYLKNMYKCKRCIWTHGGGKFNISMYKYKNSNTKIQKYKEGDRRVKVHLHTWRWQVQCFNKRKSLPIICELYMCGSSAI